MTSEVTKKNSRATAMPAEQRRAAIIKATCPMMVKHGEMLTTRQIAEAAGIAEGTIFGVFADKDDLLTATLEAVLDQRPLDNALAKIDRSAPFEAQLVEATEIITRRVIDVWSLLSALGPTLRAKASRPMPDSDALIEIFAPHTDQITMPPQNAARFLRALTLSLTHPMVAGEPVTADQIVALFLNGVGAKPQQSQLVAPLRSESPNA